MRGSRTKEFVDVIMLTIVINWNIIRHMGTCFL